MPKRRRAGGPSGILLIDKPSEWTSHDVVAKTRGILGQPRIGHTGTLDPAATGLLVLCAGQATRLVEFMSGHDKDYEGEIRLGVTTETDDAEGEVVESRPVPPFSTLDLVEIKGRFRGEIQQVPPAYSAVKIGGQRAYAMARKGQDVQLEPRTVRIERLELEPIEPNGLRIRISCGAGTYVRSLARDIGAAIGCGAHLASLRRTRVGAFRVEEATTLEDLQILKDADGLAEVIRPLDEGVMEYDAVVLGADRARALGNGVPIRVARSAHDWRPSERSRLYNLRGEFHGVVMVQPDGDIKPLKMMTSA
jgi:tRNA pseudouridine55 synthase